MRALQLNALEGPRALELVEVPEPEWQEGTVLIEVHAAGASFPDLLLSRGEYQIRVDPPFVPGIEVAGVVRQAPPHAPIRVGDRVGAVTVMGGGFAELALAPLDLTFAAPPRVSFAETVALTVNYQTAWLALVRRGRLASGETALVHGAGGGVGTAAIEVAKALGARVLAVTSTAGKAEAAIAAGAEESFAADEDWVAAAYERTEGRGVDVVVDPVGGERFAQSVRCLRPEGRLLVIGFAAGQIPHVAANRVLLRQIDIVGVNWGGLLSFDPGYPRQCASEISALVGHAKLHPLIGARYPLADGAQALRDLQERKASGKVILDVRG
jgi:NADPH:quinone reductase